MPCYALESSITKYIHQFTTVDTDHSNGQVFFFYCSLLLLIFLRIVNNKASSNQAKLISIILQNNILYRHSKRYSSTIIKLPSAIVAPRKTSKRHWSLFFLIIHTDFLMIIQCQKFKCVIQLSFSAKIFIKRKTN